MIKQIAALLLLIITTIGCSSTKTSDDMNESNGINLTSILTNNMWELTAIQGKAVNQSGLTGDKVHFSLNQTNQTIAGYAGCNTFRGTYIIESGNRIRFSDIASTRMACHDAVIDENEFLKLLGQVDNYTIKDGILKLNVGRKAPLATFKKAVQEEPIVEKYWKLVKLGGRAVQMSENQEREVYFMLKRDENRVVGFAGCNTLTGTYTLDEGNRIRFSNMAGTLKLCPDVEFRESEFFKVFEQADNYSAAGDRLTLNVGRRAPLAVFTAVYF